MIAQDLFKANTLQSFRRFASLLLALSVGIALLLASSNLIGESVADNAKSLDRSSELSVLELGSVAPGSEPRSLTKKAVKEIGDLPGVELVVGGGGVGTTILLTPDESSEASMGTAKEALSGAFFATPRFPWSQPPDIQAGKGSKQPQSLSRGQVLLPNTVRGIDLSALRDAQLRIEYTRRTGQGTGVPDYLSAKVVGFFDNADPRRAGDAAMYASPADFDTLYGAMIGAVGSVWPSDASYSSVYVKADSAARAGELARTLSQEGFAIAQGGGATSLPRVLDLVQRINLILAGALAVFGVGVGTALARTWSSLRRWDTGALLSLGKSPRSIKALYSWEMLAVGLGVGILGVLLGTTVGIVTPLLLGGRLIAGAVVPDSPTLPPMAWIAGSLLLPPAAMVLGAQAPLRRLCRLEPDEALRRPD